MKKLALSISLLTIVMLAGVASIGFGNNGNFSERELVVKDKIANTFTLNTDEYKAFSTRDVYDDSVSQLKNPQLQNKIAEAIQILKKDGDFKVGDFKPMVFVKGNIVLIGIKHPDNTATLTEFDMSKEKPLRGEKQMKQLKEAK